VEPQNARSRRTRAALLEAAREIVEGDGLPALTMAAVAERADISRRAVYLHFESRGQLVTALFDHVNEQEDLAASLRGISTAPDAAVMIAEWAAHLGRFHPRIARVARAVQRVHDTDEDAARHWRLIQQDWRRLCARVARRVKDEGRLAPTWTVDTMTDMLQALMSLDVLETLLDERGWSPSRYSRHLCDVARSSFLKDAPGNPPPDDAPA
jgi:AcrR family transcriptional regulator